MNKLWSRPSPEILRELETDRAAGLTARQAERALERLGPNELAGRAPDPFYKRFSRQLKDPMVLVLLFAALLSLLSGGGQDLLEAAIILGIVLLNAIISITQESSAEKALEALRKLSAPQAKVIRDGSLLRVDTTRLVPGDILVLEAGDLVPADARILECSELKADESALTGESLPVSKSASDTLSPDTPLGDRINMLLSSTVITNGRAIAVVTATGMNTEVGRIAGMLLDEPPAVTPLQRRMSEISKTLSFLCLAVCAVMFGVGLLHHKTIPEMFLTAVSLAVAAIPEGLPAIVTIVLALGVSRMAKQGAIVKKLPAVETLGCAGVICSDKTGTLTRNKMTVTELWSPDPADRRELLTVGALCSDTILTYESGAPKTVGDPTENALVEAALREGLDKNRLEKAFPRVEELPFDSTRKLMSTVHPVGGRYRVMVKGAPDVLLGRCTHCSDGDRVRPLTAALRAEVLTVNGQMASRALRVLGFAYRELDSLPDRPTSDLLERDLVFCGLAGMIDPPRPDAAEAVARCFHAGIRPVMITGDHKLTALAIARTLSLVQEGDRAVTGEELDFMPQDLLEREIHKFSVFARVSPEHKLRIVKAWQKRGTVTAMTGDGVNDAPALKASDIGCAMGIAGTDVAKGAADMILTDDRFATIVRAVEEGRGIYANIKKAIHYLLSCNLGEIVTLFAATLLGFPRMPLAAVQLLWLNLVTDSLPALALGMEPVEAGVMDRPPRPADLPLFDRSFSLRLAWQGLAVGGVTLAAFLWAGGTSDAACTMAFATLTFSQLFHAFDVRSEDASLRSIGLCSNPAMNKAFLIGVALQLAVLLFPPFMELFQVVSLTGRQWLRVGVLSLLPTLLCEGEKAVRRALRRGKSEKNAKL